MIDENVVYLHAYHNELGDGLLCELSGWQQFRHNQSYGGVIRGEKKVIVFCTFVLGQPVISKDDFVELAKKYLNNELTFLSVDLGG